MCEEHVPNVLDHLMTYGQLTFPKLEEIDDAEKTSFVEWKQFGKNWYQGEINASGTWHGRGIAIIPQQSLQISVFNKGKLNGPTLIFNPTLTTATYIMGEVEKKEIENSQEKMFEFKIKSK